MALEVATYIHQLNPANPDGDNDPKSQGDDHFHLLKQVLLNTFANVLGAVTASHTEINYLTGITSAVIHAAQKNVANGVGGLDSAARLLNAQMPTDPSFTTARLTSTIPVDLSSSGHGIQIGAATAANLAISSAIIQARSNGSAAGLQINPYDGQVDVGKPNGTAAVILRGGGTYIAASSGVPLRIRNSADGNPPITAIQSNRLYFETSGGLNQAVLGYPDTKDFYIGNSIRGGGFLVDTTNTGGSAERGITVTSGGGVELRYQGVGKFSTTSAGIQVTGDVAGGDGGAHSSRIIGYDSAGIARYSIGYLGDSNLYIDAYNRTATQIVMRGRNGAGTVDNNMATFNPDSTVGLYYANALKFQTEGGGATVFGTLNATTALQQNGAAVMLQSQGVQGIATTASTGTVTTNGGIRSLSCSKGATGVYNYTLAAGQNIKGVVVTAQNSTSASMAYVDSLSSLTFTVRCWVGGGPGNATDLAHSVMVF